MQRLHKDIESIVRPLILKNSFHIFRGVGIRTNLIYTIMADVSRWIQAALAEAKKGQEEGGLPIGSVLIDPETNRIVSTGHNLRVQTGDPTAHAEMVCIKKAGRRRDWHKLVLVSTLR